MCIGDVVGTAGCEFLRSHLSSFKRQQKIDLVICNGENSADGNGITVRSAEHIFTSGADVITLGNHSFRRKEVFPFLDENPFIIRPANYPSAQTPGKGFCTVDMGFATVAVVNLMGQQYMDANLDNPFSAAERILKEIDANIIIVDFHAEATSEKRAMGFFLDGRVSAVFGTHTHVMTADAQVLDGGTGYITDVGMTGSVDSVLGMDIDTSIRRLKDKISVRYEPAMGPAMINGVIAEIDADGRCTSFKRFTEYE